MIANSTILTGDSRIFNFEQFYYSPNFVLNGVDFNSLYSFLTYKQPWNETILTSNVSDTVFMAQGGIVAGSNNISILSEDSLSEFFPGQTVSASCFVGLANVISIIPELMAINLDIVASNSYIGEMKFSGVNQNDLITICGYKSSFPLSNTDGYYNDCAIYVDVENVSGGLTYTRNIIGYDANTGTIKIDVPFNDSPPLTNKSSIRLYHDDAHPPKPKETVQYIKQTYKDMFYMKLLGSDDFCPVIERINWTYGNKYDYYRDDVNIKQKDSNGNLIYHYYVMNSYYQVFKCLWNNNGAQSTVEPYFVSGNFDDITNIFTDPTDGYKWKYMYTVSASTIQKFLDGNYIPVPITAPPDLTASSEGSGGIEAINVLRSGVGYNDLYAAININITGDGTGASAIASVDRTANVISDIIITNTGSNYTYANVSINSTLGSGCIAVAGISPIGGSGQDILSELACDRIMVALYYNPTEDPSIPEDMQIRQVGLISNPISHSTYPKYSNSAYIKTSTDLIVFPGAGAFQRGELVFQAKNNSQFSNSNFIGTCIDFDPLSNKISVVNLNGIPMLNSSIYGKNSGCVRSLFGVNNPDIIPYSGRILYIQNVQEIQRSPDSIELFRIVLKF